MKVTDNLKAFKIMKTIKYIFACLFVGLATTTVAQTAENLVLWDFRSTVGITTSYDYATAPVLPDSSNTNNTAATFFTESRKITGQNGYVFSTGWEFIEASPHYWIVNNVKTDGYYSLAFMFDMGASSGNAPRDFEVEYCISGTDTWVSLGTLMSPQSLTTKTFPLPRECEAKTISLRIRLTSNYKINGVNLAQTNTQNRLKNVKVTGFVEPTNPSVVTSLSTYSICNTEKNTPASINIDITGKKLTGPLTLSVLPPFSVNKTTLEPVNESVTETVVVNFTPTVSGEYNDRLIISGGGAETKIISLRILALGYTPPDLLAQGYLLLTTLPVNKEEENTYKVKATEKGISVSDAEGLMISIYNVSGVQINKTIGTAGNQEITLPYKGVFLVKTGNTTTKIIR